MRVVIVGSGLGGVETARALQERGFDGELVVLGEETESPYDRPPLSKHVLRGEREPFRLLPADHRIDLRLGVRATGLDVDRRVVTTDQGDEPYDALVLATGASPRRLPGRPGLVLRTLADSLALREALVEGTRLVVVGAGLIGCEVGASARALGCEVALVDALPVPCMRVLGPVVGERVADLHRDHGVVLHLGVGLASVGQGEAVLTNGTRLPFDVLLEALGAAPTVEWLGSSGMPVDDGVLCDAAGRTDVPGIWALGDVARWDGVRVEHWTSAVDQAAVVAAGVLGTVEPLDTVPYWWSEQYDLRLQGLGLVHPDDDVQVVTTGTRRRDVALYSREGLLSAVVGFSASAAVTRLRQAVADRLPLEQVLASLG